MSERERLQREADDLEAKIRASYVDEDGLRNAISILETKMEAVRHSTHGLVMEKRRVLKQIEELDSAPGEYP